MLLTHWFSLGQSSRVAHPGVADLGGKVYVRAAVLGLGAVESETSKKMDLC